MSRSGGRIRYEGFLPRDRLAGVLDAATVAILPDDPTRSLGQSSMKTYDFSARGLRGQYHYNAIASWRINEKGEAANALA